MKKLKTPLKQSQRDSRWASVMLGYNTSQPYTIGNFGCLITSFANYIGKTPLEVNDILKANQGYVNGGLFVWSKSTALGLKEVYCSPRYNDAVTNQGLEKMRQLIDEGRPLICEIDFNPTTIQEEMHFVLVHGYDETKEETFYAIDPYTGSEIDLSVYGGVRRTLYKFRAYDKTLPFEDNYYLGIDLNNKDSVKVCVATWKDVVDGKYVKKEEVEKKIQEATLPLQKTINEKDQTISNLNSQITQLEKDKNTLSDELKQLQSQLENVKECPNQLIDATQQLNQAKLDYEKAKGDWQIKEQGYLKTINTLKTKYDKMKGSSLKKILLDYIYGKS